jgi:hypothetical protein
LGKEEARSIGIPDVANERCSKASTFHILQSTAYISLHLSHARMETRPQSVSDGVEDAHEDIDYREEEVRSIETEREKKKLISTNAALNQQVGVDVRYGIGWHWKK